MIQKTLRYRQGDPTDLLNVKIEMETREKRKIFINRSPPENFRWENFSGQVPTESLRTEDLGYVNERGVEIFFTVFCLPEVGRCQ